MQFKPTLLALALAAVSSGAFAAPVTISDLTVTGGIFSMPPFASNINWTNPNASANFVGGYVQMGSLFPFGSANVFGFTGDGTTAPYGGTPVTGGPVPSGTVDAATGTINLNLSAFTAEWNGTNFNQGSPTVTGTWDPTTGAYTASWSSLIVGGAFNGNTGYWTFNGTAVAAPVPEASTYGMMVVGLGLVGAAVMRRRKS